MFSHSSGMPSESVSARVMTLTRLLAIPGAGFARFLMMTRNCCVVTVLAALNGVLGGDHLICVVSEQAPAEYLAMLRDKGISYVVAGRSGVDLAAAVERLGLEPGKRVILTVGTDCAIGKMSVALELVAAARRHGAGKIHNRLGAVLPRTGMEVPGCLASPGGPPSL